MKKISLLLVILLVVVLGTSVFACKDPVEPPVVNPPGPAEGWITSSATVEEAAGELIKTLFNTAKSASKERLNALNPCVSWQIKLSMDINGKSYITTFEINYDNRDSSKTEMRLLFSRANETDPYVSVYYFQDPTIDGRTPGNLYLKYGEAKIIIPLRDTFLGELFPISFGDNVDFFVTNFVSNNLFTTGDVVYNYKNTSDGKVTKNYSLQVDLKTTLNHIVTLIKSNGNYADEDISESLAWMVESIFGVDIDKINTQLPTSIIKINFTTEGASKNTAGTGNIKEVILDIDAAESDYKEGLFRGESYNAHIVLEKIKASTKLIEDFPKEGSKTFEDYLAYNETALKMNGSLMMNKDEENLYDFSTSILYDGLAETQNNDKISFTVTEKGDSEAIFMDFRIENNTASLQFEAEDGNIINLNFAFDIDKFIECVISAGGDNAASLDLLKIASYILGSVQIWDDLSVSVKIDAKFYKGILALDATVLADCLQSAYTFAGGTGSICFEQIENQLGVGVTLEDVLEYLLFSRDMVFILDKGDTAFDTIDNRSIK